MNDLQGKRVVLIGGCGFIGHNLALELRALGANVTVIDSLAVNNVVSFASTDDRAKTNKLFYRQLLTSRIELLESTGVQIIVEDARNYHQLNHALGSIKPDTIVHLAAVSHANQSNKDPHSTFDHSLRTLENALDWARTANAHFIYMSSSMVYGNFSEDSVTEDTVCNPLGIYGALKFAGEKIVEAYHQVFDLPYTIIRPSALYGERCVSRRVTQIFVEKALSGEPIIVNGDGSDRLDFTYIKDLTGGLCAVVAKEEAQNHVFNITYGNARSVSELVELLKHEFPSLKVHFEPRDKLMPKRGTLSNKKCRELLNYEPKFSLENGFAQYVSWYRSAWADVHGV